MHQRPQVSTPTPLCRKSDQVQLYTLLEMSHITFISPASSNQIFSIDGEKLHFEQWIWKQAYSARLTQSLPIKYCANDATAWELQEVWSKIVLMKMEGFSQSINQKCLSSLTDCQWVISVDKKKEVNSNQWDWSLCQSRFQTQPLCLLFQCRDSVLDVTHLHTLSCWSEGVQVLQCPPPQAGWAGHWCGTLCLAPDATLCRWVTPHHESPSTWTGWPGTGFPSEWRARPPRWSWCWAGWSDTWGLPAGAGGEQ